MIKYDNENESISSSIGFTANIIKNAKELILVLRNNNDQEWLEMDLLPIGAAIENMCLEAENLSISTLWIGDIFFVNNEICSKLNITEGKIISAIAIGYKDQNPNPRPRKGMDEILI